MAETDASLIARKPDGSYDYSKGMDLATGKFYGSPTESQKQEMIQRASAMGVTVSGGVQFTTMEAAARQSGQFVQTPYGLVDKYGWNPYGQYIGMDVYRQEMARQQAQQMATQQITQTRALTQEEQRAVIKPAIEMQGVKIEDPYKQRTPYETTQEFFRPITATLSYLPGIEVRRPGEPSTRERVETELKYYQEHPEVPTLMAGAMAGYYVGMKYVAPKIQAKLTKPQKSATVQFGEIDPITGKVSTARTVAVTKIKGGEKVPSYTESLFLQPETSKTVGFHVTETKLPSGMKTTYAVTASGTKGEAFATLGLSGPRTAPSDKFFSLGKQLTSENIIKTLSLSGTKAGTGAKGMDLAFGKFVLKEPGATPTTMYLQAAKQLSTLKPSLPKPPTVTFTPLLPKSLFIEPETTPTKIETKISTALPAPKQTEKELMSFAPVTLLAQERAITTKQSQQVLSGAIPSSLSMTIQKELRKDLQKQFQPQAMAQAQEMKQLQKQKTKLMTMPQQRARAFTPPSMGRILGIPGFTFPVFGKIGQIKPPKFRPFRVGQKKGYVPSLTASLLGIKAPAPPRKLWGIGLRPIPVKRKKKKRR